MKLVFRSIIPLLLLFVLIPSLSKAQEWEYGIALGTSGYMGEYNQDKIFKFNSVAGSIGAKYNFNPTWGMRGGLSLIGLNGKANYDADRAFENKTLFEIAVLPEFNFFKFEPNKNKNSYTPYVFAGIGGRLDGMSSKKILKRAVVPFGAGFKYNLRGALSLNMELAYRLTADDKLDDYASGLPINVDPNKSNIFDKINNTDSYMTFQIGLTYTFFKQGCPTW